MTNVSKSDIPPTADPPGALAPAAVGTPPGATSQPAETELKLYFALVDQLQRYNSIIWQAPTALLAANILAVERFRSFPLLLLPVAFVNATLIFAYHRMVVQQAAIIDATRKAEGKLRNAYPDYVPSFKQSKIRAPRLMVWTLAMLDVALAVYSIVLLR